ncbi:phosphoribosylformylglycinamidine synthase subunit PurQ [Chloroflexota bacterium]
MNEPKALILRATGTNCDEETAYAFHLAGATTEAVHINRLCEGEVVLDRFQIFVIPGGFTYGDDLGAGKVLANELILRLGDNLFSFVENGGLVLGICNGFQVLVRAGLLPAPTGVQSISLLPNTSGRFECRWVHLRVAEDSPCVFTRGLSGFELAVAHGEGRLHVPSEVEDTIVPALHYCGPDLSAPEYPDNPNGSYRDIAGLTDSTGRILGLMPHPERFVRRSQHPAWTRHDEPEGEGDGLRFFTNAVQYARGLQ